MEPRGAGRRQSLAWEPASHPIIAIVNVTTERRYFAHVRGVCFGFAIDYPEPVTHSFFQLCCIFHVVFVSSPTVLVLVNLSFGNCWWKYYLLVKIWLRPQHQKQWNVYERDIQDTLYNQQGAYGVQVSEYNKFTAKRIVRYSRNLE